MSELEKLKVHTCEMAKIIEGLKSEHLTEYIEDQLEEIIKVFFGVTDGSADRVAGCDVQKVRSLLMDIYKTGSLEKS